MDDPLQPRNRYLRYGVITLILAGLLSYFMSAYCVPEFCTRDTAQNLGMLSAIILVPIIVFGLRVRRLHYQMVLTESHEAQRANARARRLQWIGLFLFVAGFIVLFVGAAVLEPTKPLSRGALAVPIALSMLIGIGMFSYGRLVIFRIAWEAGSPHRDADIMLKTGFFKIGSLVFWIAIALLLVAFFNVAEDHSLADKAALKLIMNLFPWTLLVGVWIYFMVRMRRDHERLAMWRKRFAFPPSAVKPMMWVEDGLVVAAVLWFIFALHFPIASELGRIVEIIGIPVFLLIGAYVVNFWARRIHRHDAGR